MSVIDDFKDVLVVDEKGNTEYVDMANADFFDLNLEQLRGTRVTQWYENRSDTSSTVMQAIINGTESIDYLDTLTTLKGKKIRQRSDTLCIKDGDRIIGAIEFAWYDTKKDVIYDAGKDVKNTADVKGRDVNKFIGESKSIRNIKDKLPRVNNLEAPVFITGETGTGKETLARYIHNRSKRANKEFVYLNCGTLPENLFESILFGTSKGSFTGSLDRDGLFQAANGGTLFLDELDSMPLSLQSKLLKAIEDKRIRKLGEEEEIEVDVRIIASCNVPIAEVIKGKSLRNDLFFRLSSIQFELPRLNKRSEDIPLLVDHFIEKLNDIYGREVRGIPEDAMRYLMKYEWPGNVRELRNVIETAFHLSENDIIMTRDIKNQFIEKQNCVSVHEETPWNDFVSENKTLPEYINLIEEMLIKAELEEYDSDLSMVCTKLGISRQSLKQKMKKLGLLDT